ncbi:MAG: hypothetical protein COA33_005090 [Fluviicola sp.]|nr:hypothetical protein [Fluviicola sp.]
MKIIYLIIISFLFISCKNEEVKAKTNSKQKIVETIAAELDADSIVSQNSELFIKELANKVLLSIKEKEWAKFTSYIHPTKGVRLSPYVHIDTNSGFILRQNNFFLLQEEKQFWGYYDGSGDSITLTVKEYFNDFVYDADFLHAEKISINNFLGSGNSLYNVDEIYPNLSFVNYYFSGFEAKYDGLDWKSMSLFFDNLDGELFLVAIVHNQWTI